MRLDDEEAARQQEKQKTEEAIEAQKVKDEAQKVKDAKDAARKKQCRQIKTQQTDASNAVSQHI